jgi:hypothetical protein
MKYLSGLEIQAGDNVLLHGELGEIEFLIETGVDHPQGDWYMSENGPGVMVHEPKVFGHVYLRETEGLEDLIFVSRKQLD